MLKRLVDRLRCPACGPAAALLAHDFSPADGDSHLSNGVLVCERCTTWYPILDSVAELVHPGLQDAEHRAIFQEKFSGPLAGLGLVAVEPADLGRTALERQLKQQEHFEWYADNPEQSYDEYQKTPFWQAADAQTLRRWRPLVADGSTVLDVGCGDGRGGNYLMTLPRVTLVGFDISRKMVVNAVHRARANGYRDRSSFLVADGTRLPFAADTFDVVVTFGALHHLPEPAGVMRALQHLLKDNGIHLALENNTSIVRPVFDFLMRLLPLWTEEAGDEPLISSAMIRQWLAEEPVEVTTATSVFVPPHLLNLLGTGGADWLLRATDAIARTLPVVRDNGGLLVVEARKRAALHQAP
jgi:SAM-dependent methyltransferase/uncharacterized protein YbaR (Trm112 family)